MSMPGLWSASAGLAKSQLSRPEHIFSAWRSQHRSIWPKMLTSQGAYRVVCKLPTSTQDGAWL
ncbi:uncharacterized protein PHACADRAFT_265956 [Phanerochaete carnosa HHB-10118-sp]|uniref:Uncharacterized protein n=1 Tax=Phanerochaete carnosa (strain HHB-10118-sp) TaxID=650164 RepID=K5WFK4_PHACS|nr:uncharacterized protein PHACADRAFT_265956 [Phanerochaete carnosa HHB-10118-sp]EKM48962.1 hypothetical protein PHACADRAFT_265956 [Phanerochaete carnosa HHB-10118-sp]